MHVERIRAPGMAEPVGHYTDAVRAGDTVYISGLVALDGAGQVVGRGDVVEQARQIFRNLALVLSAAGASAEDVVKVTIFMRDIRRRADINPIRQAFFGTHRPASTMVEVRRLVSDDLLLEIEAVAVLPGQQAVRP
jgi:2-iminobutanoate/2-iminopropanoate deaminase